MTGMNTIIFLANGQSVQTRDNTAADIAGLVNAGAQKIYTCADAFSPEVQHNIVISNIVDVQGTTAQ